jgi:hypothetical protein
VISARYEHLRAPRRDRGIAAIFGAAPRARRLRFPLVETRGGNDMTVRTRGLLGFLLDALILACLLATVYAAATASATSTGPVIHITAGIVLGP